MPISPLASVDPKAELDASVEVGPFCVVGPDVRIGPGTVLHPSVTILGRVRIGAGNVIFPHASIGLAPQDLSYRGEPTEVLIGDSNVIRECATIHRASAKEEGVTRVGSRCYLMVSRHVAHDADVGDDVIFGNNVLIGGHVQIESRATLNGGAAVHPFTRIGRLAYVGGLTRIVHDVPPFMIIEGHPSRVRGPNSVGMQRAGLAQDTIEMVAKAYRRIYRYGRPREEVLRELEREDGWPEEVRYLCDFLRASAAGKHGRFRESLRRKPPA
jgi:UDP-N-acetylglucosamine acyltransferase